MAHREDERWHAACWVFHNTSSTTRRSRGAISSICLIPSILPMPEVVRTSLLSPRWRNLWASAPFIYIDYMDFVIDNDLQNPVGSDGEPEDSVSLDSEDESVEESDGGYSCDPDEKLADAGKLEEFGYQLLLLRDCTVPLDGARIFVGHGDRTSCKSSAWIRSAIRLKARWLHIYGARNDPILFAHRSTVPSQHLEVLKLQDVWMTHESFEPLNHDFSVLECLELERCNIWTAVQELSSTSLKTLRIIRCEIMEKDLLICARNLTHLSILDPTCSHGAIVTRDLPCLLTASISLRSDDFHCEGEILHYHILNGLSNVTTLELHAPLHELAFETGLQTCPVFHNLTSLGLGEWCMAADFDPLLCILRRSLKLKDLSFQLKMEQCGPCKDEQYASSSDGYCSSSTDNSQETQDRCEICKDAESALSLGELLAGSYPSIERIIIYCSKDDPKLGALVQTLLPFVKTDGRISIHV